MKIQIKPMILLCMIISSLLSCGEENGPGIRPNPFENNVSNTSYLKVDYSSNADTVFLTWDLLSDTVKFDYYQIVDNKSDKVIKVDRDKKSCILTHIPYNQLLSVSVSLVKKEQPFSTAKTDVIIDGLDKIFAGTLIPNKGSVTGGDGTYSILLPDGRSIFLMGDSFTGTVTDGARSTQDHMFRNTYILYDQGKVSAIYGANGDKTSAAVPPGVTNEGMKWYWPGHGFVSDNKLYIFQTLMYQGSEGMWGFAYEKTDILEYELPQVELKQTVSIPFNGSPDIHYGMASLKEDDYVYIYAQVDVDNSLNTISDALVARTTMSNLYTSWEYFDGLNWSPNSSDAVKMQGLSSVAISSQFNVFKLNGKYVLLTQKKNFNSGEIYTFIADNPQGPWYNKKLLYTTTEQKAPNILTYNAMAHPQFVSDGMILVSYNINTLDFTQQLNDVTKYRPKFFWVGIDEILNK